MDKNGRILIVDDDSQVREAMYEEFIDDYDVTLAGSGQEALDIVTDDPQFNAVILDIRMARMDGFQAANRFRETAPLIPIIFCTGFPGDYSEDEIERQHAPFDIVGKNESPNRLRRAVKNAVAQNKLQTSSEDLVELARREYGMVGASPQMRAVYQQILRIGPTTRRVMILGPTGSGKELVARAIHKASPVADQKLRIFACSDQNPDLIDSELFGHTRGAFTGAVESRRGYFEAAHGSTLFLDEIGDLDPRTQVKLLRAIEQGEITPVGSSELKQVNVRVICATNRDLEDLVHRGKFRQDLYFRLKGIKITLPPLRERPEDIPLLVNYFMEQACRNEQTSSMKVIAPAAREMLIEHDWPGNVRDLSDTIQALVVMTAGDYISAGDVAEFLRIQQDGDRPPEWGLTERVDQFRRREITKVLDSCNGNKAAAAKVLNQDPANFRKLMKKLGMDV